MLLGDETWTGWRGWIDRMLFWSAALCAIIGLACAIKSLRYYGREADYSDCHIWVVSAVVLAVIDFLFAWFVCTYNRDRI